MQAPDGLRENNAASSAEIDSASHQGRLPWGSFWANAGLMLVSAVVTLVFRPNRMVTLVASAEPVKLYT